MLTAFDDMPPSSVVSFDHSFNTSKRTKECIAPLPPEKLPTGDIGRGKRVSVEENASLYMMNCDGRVSL